MNKKEKELQKSAVLFESNFIPYNTFALKGLSVIFCCSTQNVFFLFNFTSHRLNPFALSIKYVLFYYLHFSVYSCLISPPCD